MLKTAFYRTNFPLLSLICQSYQTYNLPVNKEFVERTERFLQDTRSKVLAMVRMLFRTSLTLIISSFF